MAEAPVQIPKQERGETQRIDYLGFTSSQERLIRGQFKRISLPMDNVQRVINAPNKDIYHRTLGHWIDQRGEIALYKQNLERLPFPGRAELSTQVHELAHANSPFNEENDRLYGGKENRIAAQEAAINTAEQTKLTRIYLNPYHKWLFQEWKDGIIDRETFYEETHAIMIELRFTNARHLEQVRDAQAKKLKRQGRTSTDIYAGATQTLLSLYKQSRPGIKSSEDLDDHIKYVKENSY